MQGFSPTIGISSAPATFQASGEPEEMIRRAVRMEFEDFFDPYQVKFFENYRLIGHFFGKEETLRTMEVLVQLVSSNPVSARRFHGEVFLNQRKFTGNDTMMMTDCDLHKLGEMLDEYFKASETKRLTDLRGLLPARH